MSRRDNKLQQAASGKDNSAKCQVATSTHLILHMLQKLDKAKFVRDDTTFLDPCCGRGTFLAVIIQKLLHEGHSKENISNRIFCGDKNYACYNSTRESIRQTFGIELKHAYHEDSLTHNFNMNKFDTVITNPPYTINGKTAIPAFLRKAMELSKSEVLFVCPAWYAVKSNQDSSKWKPTIAGLNNFGVMDIEPFDNKVHFPTVDFMHAAITHLSKSSDGVVDSFTDQFASQGRPDNTDVERIVTRRGASISHKSSDFVDEYSKETPYRMVTSMSNNGEFEATIKYYHSLEAPIKSPWAVVVQEQSARQKRINDAVVVDNTKGDVGVLANVYPIYCSSKEDAETVKEWVTSEKFNEMLPTAIGSDPVLKVGTLGLMPKYEV